MTEEADILSDADDSGSFLADALSAPADAEMPHQRLAALELLLASASASARPTICCLALRAALHPALAPYRTNPLLLLEGRFVSVDAQLYGLTAYAKEQGLVQDIAALLPEADRLLVLEESPSASEGNRAEAGNPFASPAIGAVPGAIYVPHLQRAVLCQILVAALPADSHSGWTAPAPLRPISPDIQAAARAALGAALYALEEQGLLPEKLHPQPLYFDICAPELSDSLLAGVSGGSLGLPLALAFLSVLLGKPPQRHFGATGAIQTAALAGFQGDMVSKIAWVAAKAAALHAALPEAPLLVPVSNEEWRTAAARSSSDTEALIVPAASVTEAARFCGLFPEAAAATNDGGKETISAIAPPRAVVVTSAPGSAGRDHEAATNEAVLEMVRAVVRRALTRRGGLLFTGKEETPSGGTSDNLVLGAYFSDPIEACAAALDVQQGLRCYLWPEAVSAVAVPSIGIGIHTSEVTQACRLMESGSAGQIIVSAELADQVCDRSPASWQWKSLGLLRLRDLQPPRPLFQVSRPPLTDTFPPLRSLDSRRHNLPLYFEPFIGREAETATLCRLLRDRATRLVTLTGTRGVGKTRLALETAAQCVDSFPDGVWCISLVDSAEQSLEGAALTTLRALRKPVSNTAPPLDQIVNEIKDRRVLLVLDNGEEPLGGTASFLEQILSRCPHVACLAASGTRIAIAGETFFPVNPLPPGASETLFLERARTAIPDFKIGEGEKPFLTALCQRLGRLPLALELAAAQARTTTVKGMLDQLNAAAVDAAGKAAGDASQREGSPSDQGYAFPIIPGALALADTLGNTYALLSEQERRLLARLSVFAGGAGFTAEAATRTLAEDETQARDTAGVSASTAALDLLTNLSERALIRQKRGSGRRVRFFMHGAVQEFARTHLRRRGEEESAQRTLAAYCLAIARGASREAQRDMTDVAEVFALLDDEMPNLRLAWGYFCDQDTDKVPDFVRDLSEYLRRAGQVQEWQGWTRIALSFVERGMSVATLAQREALYRSRALACLDSGEHEAAVSLLDAVFSCAERNETVSTAMADAWSLRGLILGRMKRPDEAVAAYEQARQLYQQIGAGQGEVQTLNNLSVMAWKRGDKAAFEAYCNDAYRLASRIDDARGRAYAVNNLGFIAGEKEDLETARKHFLEFLTLSRRHRETTNIAIGLLNVGDILEKQGNYETALPVLTLAEKILERLGHPHADEAARYIERGGSAFNPERLANLRLEFERRSLEELLKLEPEKTTHTLSLPADNNHSAHRAVSENDLGMLY